jgi:hypothetical protein
MDTASQYDLANLIGEHWGVVIEAYRHGLASGFGASTGPSIPGLAAVGILDSQWNKLGADFETVVIDVAAGRDVENLETADFLRIAARHSEWYVSSSQ